MIITDPKILCELLQKIEESEVIGPSQWYIDMLERLKKLPKPTLKEIRIQMKKSGMPCYL